MKDKSKRLTVVNTEKKPSEKKEVQQVIVQPSSSSSSHAPGFNPNLYLLKSVWDSVFEIKTDVSGQKYIFGKLPVVTKYGITMYADDGNVDIPQLAEGLPFDQRTIWFNPETKQIEVIGGTGGGGEGGVSIFWDLSGIPSWITNSKPIYNYSEIKNTPDLSVFVTSTALSETLADYATLTYLTGELKKYVTIKDDQDIVGVKNFLNGIKISHMPIRKLQDDVLYIDGNLVVRGGVTMYSEGEVDIPTLMDSIAVDSSMYNSGGVIGVNRATTSSVGVASFNPSNFTVDANGMVSLSSVSLGASKLGDLSNVDSSIDATASVDRVLYQPAGSAMWTWRELPKDGVVGDYLPLSGGQMTGGIGTILRPVDYPVYVPAAGSFQYSSVDEFNSICSFIGSMYCRPSNIWYTGILSRHANFNSSNTSDSSKYGMYLLAEMEASLITADTANIVWNVQKNGVWGTQRTILDSLNWSKFIFGGNVYNQFTVNGQNASGYYPSILFHIPNVAWSQFLMVNDGTVWLVGGSSQAAERVGLAIGGLNCLSVLSHGGITMYSDQRKKTILNHVELSLKQIADAPLIQHYYNSDQNKTTHVGSIAQYWAQINDWFCKLDAEGYYTMEIQNCALASAISIARHLDRYETKTDKTIRKMKQRITELEDEVERLKQN